jgi:hypothetical protein
LSKKECDIGRIQVFGQIPPTTAKGIGNEALKMNSKRRSSTEKFQQQPAIVLATAFFFHAASGREEILRRNGRT